MISKRITCMTIPKEEQVLFTLDGESILSVTNISGITADIGTGKSHICEIIASHWLNPSIGEFNLKCVYNEGICLYIDTERSEGDCGKGIKRIIQHCKQTTDYIDKHLQFESFLTESSVFQKLEHISTLLKENPLIKIVIIDGILDLIRNPNDITEASDLASNLVNMAIKFNIGIFYTVHGNRNDPSGKAKGHIGDALQRKSEAYLKIIKDKEDINKRILTENFDNGKVRNGNPNIYTLFQWDIVTKSFKEYVKVKKEVDVVNEFIDIFNTDEYLSHKEIVERYMSKTKRSEATTKRHINQAIKANQIIKDYGRYRLPK